MPDAAVWFVVVTFLFPGNTGARTSNRQCSTVACVEETRQLALQDPAAIRFQVWNPGNSHWTDKLSGLGIFPPDEDIWFQ